MKKVFLRAAADSVWQLKRETTEAVAAVWQKKICSDRFQEAAAGYAGSLKIAKIRAIQDRGTSHFQVPYARKHKPLLSINLSWIQAAEFKAQKYFFGY